jgi:hypothetical protein
MLGSSVLHSGSDRKWDRKIVIIMIVEVQRNLPFVLDRDPHVGGGGEGGVEGRKKIPTVHFFFLIEMAFNYNWS